MNDFLGDVASWSSGLLRSNAAAQVEEAAEATVTASKSTRWWWWWVLHGLGQRTYTAQRRPPANEHLIEIKLAVFGFADGQLSSNHISGAKWRCAHGQSLCFLLLCESVFVCLFVCVCPCQRKPVNLFHLRWFRSGHRVRATQSGHSSSSGSWAETDRLPWSSSRLKLSLARSIIESTSDYQLRVQIVFHFDRFPSNAFAALHLFQFFQLPPLNVCLLLFVLATVATNLDDRAQRGWRPARSRPDHFARIKEGATLGHHRNSLHLPHSSARNTLPVVLLKTAASCTISTFTFLYSVLGSVCCTLCRVTKGKWSERRTDIWLHANSAPLLLLLPNGAPNWSSCLSIPPTAACKSLMKSTSFCR